MSGWLLIVSENFVFSFYIFITFYLINSISCLFFFSAVDFFNQINMLYGTITEFCTEESCPIMSAGPKYEYHWADGHTVKKPIKCSAPKYIDYLMTWVQDQLDDETLFPSKIGDYFIFFESIISNLWDLISNPFCRSTFPEKFLINRKNYLETIIQSIRPYLSSAFQWSCAARRGSTFKYIVQAFHIFCSGIQLYMSNMIRQWYIL